GAEGAGSAVQAGGRAASSDLPFGRQHRRRLADVLLHESADGVGIVESDGPDAEAALGMGQLDVGRAPSVVHEPSFVDLGPGKEATAAAPVRRPDPFAPEYDVDGT